MTIGRKWANSLRYYVHESRIIHNVKNKVVNPRDIASHFFHTKFADSKTKSTNKLTMDAPGNWIDTRLNREALQYFINLFNN